MTADEEPIDVVLTVGDLDPAVVALRDFLHRSGALEVQGLVDRGGAAAPVLIACGRATPIAVTEEERTVHMPHGVELPHEAPELPVVPHLPPFEVDGTVGQVTGPLGGVEALARGLDAVAGHLGGRSVALAFFATTDADTPLGIAARPGDSPVLTLGEEQFHLP